MFPYNKNIRECQIIEFSTISPLDVKIKCEFKQNGAQKSLETLIGVKGNLNVGELGWGGAMFFQEFLSKKNLLKGRQVHSSPYIQLTYGRFRFSS